MDGPRPDRPEHYPAGRLTPKVWKNVPPGVPDAGPSILSVRNGSQERCDATGRVAPTRQGATAGTTARLSRPLDMQMMDVGGIISVIFNATRVVYLKLWSCGHMHFAEKSCDKRENGFLTEIKFLFRFLVMPIVISVKNRV